MSDTTDEQILWLSKHGFTLPEGLRPPGISKGCSGFNCWEVKGTGGAAYYDSGDQRVHDLCAAHFAREMGGKSIVHDPDFCHEWSVNTATGDSATAIDALYQAIKGSQ